MKKSSRENIALVLAALSTVAALTGVAIGIQARNDVVASAKYSSALSECQSASDRYRRFFLKLVNSPEVPFDAYFPGEVTTFARVKVELIDSLNALAYSSSDFEEVTSEYIRSFSRFHAPLENPFLGNSTFEISKLADYVKQNNELSELGAMPSKLHAKCNEVLSAIRG